MIKSIVTGGCGFIGSHVVTRLLREGHKVIKKLVYAASSSCYGIPDSFPTCENAEIRCEYPYALTKRLGEELVMHWGKVYNIPVISLRLFNVYGTRSRTGGTYGADFHTALKNIENAVSVKKESKLEVTIGVQLLLLPENIKFFKLWCEPYNKV
ncbi:MAG: NAD-dependent epimerase/dehydratase family protein [Oscillospiraceae bacterium]|nr:NAD-dependent epimerase/dehydratase family protein [Oscillospiraceae bacterium]MCL2280256.1 NAD-dependent epimerase/dehydratase family protein [Oscillospiraceae bacterium]